MSGQHALNERNRLEAVIKEAQWSGLALFAENKELKRELTVAQEHIERLTEELGNVK